MPEVSNGIIYNWKAKVQKLLADGSYRVSISNVGSTTQLTLRRGGKRCVNRRGVLQREFHYVLCRRSVRTCSELWQRASVARTWYLFVTAGIQTPRLINLIFISNHLVKFVLFSPTSQSHVSRTSEKWPIDGGSFQRDRDFVPSVRERTCSSKFFWDVVKIDPRRRLNKRGRRIVERWKNTGIVVSPSVTRLNCAPERSGIDIRSDVRCNEVFCYRVCDTTVCLSRRGRQSVKNVGEYRSRCISV